MAKDDTMYMAMPMHISPSGQQILPDDDDGVINVNQINISAQSWLKLDQLHYQSHLDSHTPGYLRFRVEGVKGVKN